MNIDGQAISRWRFLSSISARWTRRSASTTQPRRRIRRVAARSSSLPREASAGLELFMNAFVRPCFLRLLRGRDARFPRNWRLALEVRPARRSQHAGGHYNGLWTCITGRPIRYAKILSTTIVVQTGYIGDKVDRRHG